VALKEQNIIHYSYYPLLMQGRALRKSPAQMRTMKGKIWNNKMETDETFSLNKIRKKTNR